MCRVNQLAVPDSPLLALMRCQVMKREGAEGKTAPEHKQRRYGGERETLEKKKETKHIKTRPEPGPNLAMLARCGL